MSVMALVGSMALARGASAQMAPPVPATPASAAPTPDAPPRFKGFSLDYSVSDSTGLNAVNYNNSLSQLFEPKWSLGKVLFPSTSRFSKLAIAARLPLNYTFAGYDPAALASNSDHGTPVPCSNLTPSSNGTVDPNQVQRCTYNNTYRPTLGDLTVAISNPGLFTIPGIDVKVNPGLRVTIPLSYESRYATMNFAVQGSLGVGRTFFDKKLSVGYSFGATKYSYQYTAATIQTQAPEATDGFIAGGYHMSDINDATASFYSDPGRAGSGAALNSSFAFSHGLTVGYNFSEKLNLSLLYMISNSFAYEASGCGTGSYGGVQTDPCANAEAVAHASRGTANGTLTSGWSDSVGGRAHRDSQIFSASLSYQFTDWVGVSASWATFSPLRYADNSFRQPFVSTNYDSFSSLSVGATFSMGYSN